MVVTGPEVDKPTPENSTPLEDEIDENGECRGSCVWFNQASVFQFGELGSTVKQATLEGKSGTTDFYANASIYFCHM